jgi:hypothetical protein
MGIRKPSGSYGNAPGSVVRVLKGVPFFPYFEGAIGFETTEG